MYDFFSKLFETDDFYYYYLSQTGDLAVRLSNIHSFVHTAIAILLLTMPFWLLAVWMAKRKQEGGYLFNIFACTAAALLIGALNHVVEWAVTRYPMMRLYLLMDIIELILIFLLAIMLPGFASYLQSFPSPKEIKEIRERKEELHTIKNHLQIIITEKEIANQILLDYIKDVRELLSIKPEEDSEREQKLNLIIGQIEEAINNRKNGNKS